MDARVSLRMVGVLCCAVLWAGEVGCSVEIPASDNAASRDGSLGADSGLADASLPDAASEPPPDAGATDAGTSELPEWRATTTSTQDGNLTAVTLRAPAGASPGNLLLAFLGVGDSGNAEQPALTPPAGWVLIDRTNHGTVGTLAIYKHLFASGESEYVWQGDRVLNGASWILAYANVHATAPIDVYSGTDIGSVQSSFSTPTLTTTGPNRLLVASFVSYSSEAGDWSTPAGMTARVALTNNDSRSAASFESSLIAAGAAQVTATVAPTQSWTIAHLLALRSAQSEDPDPSGLCPLPGGQAPDPNYGAETQTTQDPIGGGMGYRRMVPPSSSPIRTSSALVQALAVASPGSVVYVDDDVEIELPGSTIAIPQGVTLASGRGRNGRRGALLFTRGRPAPLFEAGANVRVTGLRFRGADKESGDHYGVPPEGGCSWAAAIRSTQPGLEVDNCEFSEWGYAGVWVKNGASETRPHIHHCYFHHLHQAGLGYGVSVDGSGGGSSSVSALIEANLFDFYRHPIASTWDEFGSYEARFNLVREHGLSGVWAMDRHSGGSDANGTFGGGSTSIHHNTYWVTATKSVGFGDGPKAGYTAEVYGNWFFDSDEPVALQRNATTGVSVHDNAMGTSAPPGTMPPSVKIVASAAEIGVGTSVRFTGKESCGYGLPVRTWNWDFGDGDIGFGPEVDHAFAAPGRYNVELMITDTLGIPAVTVMPVLVLPANDHQILSFWVNDSYRLSSSPRFSKHVFLDTAEIWSASAAGDDGWQHVVIDLTAEIPGLAAGVHTLTLQVDQEVAIGLECGDEFVYWDDVHLFGGVLENGDFEQGLTGWTYTAGTNCTAWSGAAVADEVRSGRTSLGFMKFCGHEVGAGCSVKATQMITTL